MKKILITLALAAAAVTNGLAQGTITWANSNGSKISTNSVVGGGATGATSAFNPLNATATTYYYALFFSTASGLVSGSGAATVGTNGAYAFNDGNWNFLNPSAISGYVVGQALGTNGAVGRYTPENTDPGHSGATVTANTTAANWVVIGWSATIGSTLSAMETWYNDPNKVLTGWIGESVVSSSIAPGDPNKTPIADSPSGVFPGAFTLGEVTPVVTPEPATIALAGLGGLSMLLMRRRKS